MRAWANDIDATESGAYGVALATLQLTDDLVAIARAETLTGADYYVAPAGANVENLEFACRLEVSGIDQSNDDLIAARLRSKVKQAMRGRSNLPAIAAVVGFSSAHVAFDDVQV